MIGEIIVSFSEKTSPSYLYARVTINGCPLTSSLRLLYIFLILENITHVEQWKLMIYCDWLGQRVPFVEGYSAIYHGRRRAIAKSIAN